MKSIKQKSSTDATSTKGDLAVQEGIISDTNADTVIVSTISTDASQLRLLKVAQLRDDIEAGHYQVPSTAIARAMVEKATSGQAPELSFLSKTNQRKVP